jgi:hypothetical protein
LLSFLPFKFALLSAQTVYTRMGALDSLTMPMRRRSRAGSELAKDEARSFLPQHERDGDEGMKGWKGLWKSQQWVIVGFAVAFGLLMVYILAVSPW